MSVDSNGGRVPSGGMVTQFPMRAEDITPSDTTIYPTGIAVIAGSTGDVTVEPFIGGNTVTFTVNAGEFVPVMVRRVLAATTATNLIGVY